MAAAPEKSLIAWLQVPSVLVFSMDRDRLVLGGQSPIVLHSPGWRILWLSPSFAAQALGKWIMECLQEHPAIEETQVVLQTRDAQGLYERFGFSGNSALMSTKVTDL